MLKRYINKHFRGGWVTQAILGHLLLAIAMYGYFNQLNQNCTASVHNLLSQVPVFVSAIA